MLYLVHFSSPCVNKKLASFLLTYSDSLLLEVAPEFKEHMGRHSLVYAANVNIYW